MLDLFRLLFVFAATPLVLMTAGWLLTKSSVMSARRDPVGLAHLFLHFQILIGFSVAVGAPRALDVTHGFFWMGLSGVVWVGMSWLSRRRGPHQNDPSGKLGFLAVTGASIFVLLGLLRLDVEISLKLWAIVPMLSAVALQMQAMVKDIDARSKKEQVKPGSTLALCGQVICWIAISAQTSSMFFWVITFATLIGIGVGCWTCRLVWRDLFLWGNWYLGTVASMAIVLGYREDMRPLMATILGGVIMAIILLAQRWKNVTGKLAASVGVVALIAAFTYGCTPLQPSDGSQNQNPAEPQGNVMKFQLAGAALRSLVDDGSQVHVQVVKLTQNADGTESLGAKEGDERVAKLISDAQDFIVDQLEVGRKEVQISIISSLEDQVGYGALRVSIGLGVNEIRDPLMIKLIPFEMRRRDWDAALDVSFIVQGSENEVIYSEVKDVIDRKCANSCHNAAAYKGALDLSSFPFRSDNLPTQEDIVKESLVAMDDFTYPMPPPPDARIPANEKAAIQAWADSGLPTKHTTADQYNSLVERVLLKWVMQGTPPQSGQLDLVKSADMRFGTSMRSMQIGGKYALNVQVLGPSGVVLKDESFPDLMLRGKGAFERAIRISYTPPTLRVPIIITP